MVSLHNAVIIIIIIIVHSVQGHMCLSVMHLVRVWMYQEMVQSKKGWIEYEILSNTEY